MNIQELDQSLQTEIIQYQKKSETQLAQAQSIADKRLYAIFLIETFHYVKHSNRHQALVAARYEELDIQYRNYCLVHAREELGHEQMALNDLHALGFEISSELFPEPLLSTKQFIDYLYQISAQGNPLARLGYTFWAEQIYSFIQPLISLIDKNIKAPRNAMSFFTNHARIDEEHFNAVKLAITKFAKNPDDWREIDQCMKKSFALQTKITEEVLLEFLYLKNGQSSRFEFLNSHVCLNGKENENGNP